MTRNVFWAAPRHLGKKIARCLLALPNEPISTAEAANWAHGDGPYPKWRYRNVRRFFVTGLGALGLLGWRRKRKANVAA